MKRNLVVAAGCLAIASGALILPAAAGKEYPALRQLGGTELESAVRAFAGSRGSALESASLRQAPRAAMNPCEFDGWQCVGVQALDKDGKVIQRHEFELETAECKAKDTPFSYQIVKKEDGKWVFDAASAKGIKAEECAVATLNKGSHHQKLDKMGAAKMAVESVGAPKK